jgi:hypothetical protein
MPCRALLFPSKIFADSTQALCLYRCNYTLSLLLPNSDKDRASSFSHAATSIATKNPASGTVYALVESNPAPISNVPSAPASTNAPNA